MPFGILRKPTTQNPFLLQEHFVDAPKAAESETTDDDWQYIILNEERKQTECQAGHQPDPPTLPSPMIFHLDDKRVADAYTQKYGSTYNDSIDIHNCNT